ncbi:MAG TPA: c-type cytochrome [Thermoanaerobaculia bacterium]|nr:c-type cytochrome [Thermoanaerobaculia bacterium]
MSPGSPRTACALLLSAALAAGPLPAQTAQTAATTPDTAPGGKLYQNLCAQCHGEKGDGLGIAAPRVMPRPRDFTAGKFKIRRTPSGALPTDDDLRDVIREGMPYTSMPGWQHLSDAQINELITAVKSFSPDFADPEKKPQPIAIPEAPEFSQESAEKGKEVYARIGCAACHGELGRGDGPSAPALTDDWGHSIRPADLTKRWTYRGGPTREDIYRTFTTGMNGTPMPSFAESLTDDERWQLVDFIMALDPRDAPGYAELVQVKWTTDEIELDLARGKKLFEDAPAAYFPVVGQITEPGRAFYPAANGVTVRALYNAREIGFLVTWHDMRADVAGRNAPNLPVPPEEDQGEATAAASSEGEGGDSVWGDAETTDAGSGDAAAVESQDVWGDDAAPAAEEGGGGDFWGEEEGTAAVTPTTEFSDAFAIQLPAQLPTGNRKPYFLFGDAQNPVDIWFVDLATKVATRYNGAGSASLSVVEGEEVSAVAGYDRGEWTVLLKRPLRGTGGVTFAEGQYVPIAFSVWDGFQRERGNKRGLTQWMYLYTMPKETPSTVWPMLRAALAVLAVEILLITWVRRRQRRPVPVSQDREVPLHV